MNILFVRADGVLISAVPEGNDSDAPRKFFLSWEDLYRLNKERTDLEMTKYQNRRQKASRKPRP